MSNESRIESAVSRWHALLAAGQQADAADLCRSCPELLPEVKRRLATLGLADPEPHGPATAGPAATTRGVLSAIDGPLSPPGYEVLDELGRGGMGVVYRARHVALNRLVALKMILSGGYAGGEELKRFRREAETVARLQHPGIVQIFEVGAHDGRPFLSLEYCPGGSLDRKLGGTPMPPRDAAALVESVARAVQAAHAAGVIHRDLKPANVLLDSAGAAKVADFGLARRVDEQGLTASNALLGTPSYMPPEQARREGRLAGPSSDVYSLGAILYECLTGRPPFRAATLLDTILQVLGEEPVPPSRLNAQVPRELETVCLKCLEKAPEGRYPSAAALADDLARWQRGEPVTARPAGAFTRALSWARRRPAVAALVAALVALTATALTVISILYGNAAAEARNAIAARNEARREKERADRRVALARYADLLARAQRAENRFDPLTAADFLARTDEGLRGWEYGRIRLSNRVQPAPSDLPFESLSWSRDGRSLAAVRPGDWSRVWDVEAGEVRFVRRAPPRAFAVALSPNGQAILCPETGAAAPNPSPPPIDDDLMISPRGLRDIKKRWRDEDIDDAAIEIVKEDPEIAQREEVAATGASSVFLGKVNGQGAPVMIPLPGEAVGMRFLRGGKSAVVLTRTGALFLLEETARRPKSQAIATLRTRAHGLAVSPNERLAACLTAEGVAVIDLTDPAKVRRFELGKDADANSAAFSPDSETLAVGDAASGLITLFDLDVGKGASFRAAPPNGRLTAVCWIPGEPARLAAADRLDGVSIRDGAGALLSRLPHLCAGGEALAASPDGKCLAIGTSSGVVLACPDGKREARTLDPDAWIARLGPPGAAGGAASLTVGDVIVEESLDKDGSDGPETWTVRHKALKPLNIHLDPRPAARIVSPDGKTVAVLDEHVIRILNAETNKEADRLLGHAGSVLGACFGPDGRLFSFAAGELKVWSVDPGYPLLSMSVAGELAGIHYDGALDCLVLMHKDRKVQLLFASKREK